MEPKEYKRRVVKVKLAEYIHLVIAQVFADINDISIDSNDELNRLLLQFQDIPPIFSN